MYEFGWDWAEQYFIAAGILVGHLLECAGQVTGGYFAGPVCKDVRDLWKIGFSLAEVNANGEAVITKVQKSGGIVTVGTCKEQLLYGVLVDGGRCAD